MAGSIINIDHGPILSNRMIRRDIRRKHGRESKLIRHLWYWRRSVPRVSADSDAAQAYVGPSGQLTRECLCRVMMFVFTTSVFYIQILALFFASPGTIYLFSINIFHIARSLLFTLLFSMSDEGSTKTSGTCASCQVSTKIRCSGCLDAPLYDDCIAKPSFYCSTACQKADWGQHKSVCRALQARKSPF